jgi:very-short-patch-repair endonuclease
MEHAICTAPVKGMFPSLPHCYKVDIADSTVKLAIEVDGRSHRSPRWRYLDKRKEEILRALGWKVMRFDNKRVLDNLHEVVAEVSTLLTSLQN